LPESSIRVLVVDDFDPWRRFYCSTLQKQPGFQVIGEASDGFEAVHQARKLQPDLILLDIGLPTLNGIEAARQIREVSAASKILFVSENRSTDIVEEALNTGAGGYVVKSNAAGELLPAVNAVLEGRPFLSRILMGNESIEPMKKSDATIPHCHEVAFCQDEASLVGSYAAYIQSALQNGHAVIMVAIEPHRTSLASRLERDGLGVTGAVANGSLILSDASDALLSVMDDDMPERTRCSTLVGNLVERAAKGIKRKHGRVVFCGGIAPVLLSGGNVEGAIRLEQLWDEITRGYGMHTLCGYVRSTSESIESSPILKRICAVHSAVHGVKY
jgi:DNA-binding NarL/FixJ family response regulator